MGENLGMSFEQFQGLEVDHVKIKMERRRNYIPKEIKSRAEYLFLVQ